MPDNNVPEIIDGELSNNAEVTEDITPVDPVTVEEDITHDYSDVGEDIIAAENEANRAKSEADRAESIVEQLEEDVGDVTTIFSRLDALDTAVESVVTDDISGLILKGSVVS